MKKVWCLSPNHGEEKISDQVRAQTVARVDAFAKTRPWYSRIQVAARFRQQFCYLDSIENGKLFPLCRLRFHDNEHWSLAFYTYSNERYQPCIFLTGKELGTVEEAIAACELYL